ncbi:MAG: hypothetical protein A2143_09220 [Gallionellales bacterium RBG_16_57_15]|nr:MAG: hypothetical protein A2143_09220 [Gallionellales bacterium RBG_16_57_15]
MLKKPAIQSGDPTKKNVQALKEVVEIICGRRGTKIAPLAATATLADVIVKVNAIIELLQG